MTAKDRSTPPSSGTPGGEGCCPPAAPQEAPTGACCPASDRTTTCCPPSGATFPDRAGYRAFRFVDGAVVAGGEVYPTVTSTLDWLDRLGHWAMRWGFGRDRYRVTPGIYALGNPDGNSPVLVTANYKLTFDVLRRDLAGRSLWLLVLDTRGINVWCAAGKGTFGTRELVGRIRSSRLETLVSHRALILPQLAAPGIAAHEVRRETGFHVLYGPIRSADLPSFLDSGQVTAAMRQVTFSLAERLVLTPVELVGMWKTAAWTLPALLLSGGITADGLNAAGLVQRGGGACMAFLGALFTGAVLAPALLPWLPGRAFALKGWLLGLTVGALLLAPGILPASRLDGLALLAAAPAFISYLAMKFTGSTPFTSPSGVEREMRRFIPWQGLALLVGAILWLWSPFY